ncbi:MAG: 3-hydroxyacyl-CoA dehydrogenase NAD-binding domain-containing protein, partial [Anaerobacillus sp.]
MKTKEIKKITVLGAGSMGHQIGMLCALGGYETTIQDINEGALKDAEEKLEGIMSKWVTKGKITEELKEAAFERLQFTTNLEEAAVRADFIIEAIVEKLDVKRDVFEKLDRLADP